MGNSNQNSNRNSSSSAGGGAGKLKRISEICKRSVTSSEMSAHSLVLNGQACETSVLNMARVPLAFEKVILSSFLHIKNKTDKLSKVSKALLDHCNILHYAYKMLFFLYYHYHQLKFDFQWLIFIKSNFNFSS